MKCSAGSGGSSSRTGRCWHFIHKQTPTARSEISSMRPPTTTDREVLHDAHDVATVIGGMLYRRFLPRHRQEVTGSFCGPPSQGPVPGRSDGEERWQGDPSLRMNDEPCDGMGDRRNFDPKHHFMQRILVILSPRSVLNISGSHNKC